MSASWTPVLRDAVRCKTEGGTPWAGRPARDARIALQQLWRPEPPTTLCWLLGVSVLKLSVDNGSTLSSRLTSTNQAKTVRFPVCQTHLLSSRLYCLLGV